MASHLEHTILRNVVKYTEIVYDPDPRNTVVAEDVDIVSDWAELNEVCMNVLPRWGFFLIAGYRISKLKVSPPGFCVSSSTQQIWTSVI